MWTAELERVVRHTKECRIEEDRVCKSQYLSVNSHIWRQTRRVHTHTKSTTTHTRTPKPFNENCALCAMRMRKRVRNAFVTKTKKMSRAVYKVAIPLLPSQSRRFATF